MSDMATNDETLNAYDSGIEKYAKSLKSDISGQLQEWFARCLLGMGFNARILEIGSGTGRDAAYVESRGYTVHRTDGSKAFVENLQSQGYEAQILNVLKQEINGTYDVVLANAVFLHFNQEEFQLAATKVFNALSTGGCFGLSLKCGEGEETTNEKMDAPRYFKYWQPEALQQSLESIGFTDYRVSVGDDWRPGKPQWLFVTVHKER